MSLLSKGCVYGIRAVLYVAGRPAAKAGQSGYVSIAEIAKALGLSFHFLTKILQGLTSRGILASYRGPRGGVALARPAGRISLLDIVDALDGTEAFHACILGLEGCGERRPCPMHREWARRRADLRKALAAARVGALARRGAFRLTD